MYDNFINGHKSRSMGLKSTSRKEKYNVSSPREKGEKPINIEILLNSKVHGKVMETDIKASWTSQGRISMLDRADFLSTRGGCNEGYPPTQH